MYRSYYWMGWVGIGFGIQTLDGNLFVDRFYRAPLCDANYVSGGFGGEKVYHLTPGCRLRILIPHTLLLPLKKEAHNKLPTRQIVLLPRTFTKKTSDFFQLKLSLWQKNLGTIPSLTPHFVFQNKQTWG